MINSNKIDCNSSGLLTRESFLIEDYLIKSFSWERVGIMGLSPIKKARLDAYKKINDFAALLTLLTAPGSTGLVTIEAENFELLIFAADYELEVLNRTRKTLKKMLSAGNYDLSRMLEEARSWKKDKLAQAQLDQGAIAPWQALATLWLEVQTRNREKTAKATQAVAGAELSAEQIEAKRQVLARNRKTGMETSAGKIKAARRRNIKKAVRARLNDPDKMTADNSKAGQLGGRARAAALSPEERRQISSNAVKARWEKDAIKNGRDIG